MTMPVTDEQEATLHAQLAGRFEEHKRLLNALDRSPRDGGYGRCRLPMSKWHRCARSLPASPKSISGC
jgi:hypothetical protein